VDKCNAVHQTAAQEFGGLRWRSSTLRADLMIKAREGGADTSTSDPGTTPSETD